MAKVYARTDAQGRLLEVQSDVFLTDSDGWVLVDEGAGDRFTHAQGNYLPGGATDIRGVYRYELCHEAQEDGTILPAIHLRPEADMAADAAMAAPPADPMTALDQRVEAVEAANNEITLLLADVIGGAV